MAWQVVAAAVVGGLNYMSSRNAARTQNDYIDRQHDLNLAQHSYDFHQAWDAHTFAQEGVDIQRYNEGVLRDYRNQTAINEWIDRDTMRIFDYNNQVATYNASVDAFETQLDYNNLAAEIALNDNTRQYNERLIQLGFQNEKTMMDLNFETRSLTDQVIGKRAELATKATDIKLKGLAQEGQVQNLGQAGRTASRNLMSVMTSTARGQAALADVMINTESAYGLNMEKSWKTADFAQRQIMESISSARDQYAADRQNIELKHWEADMAAEGRIAPSPILAPELSRPVEIPETRFQDTAEPPTQAEWDQLRPEPGARASTGIGPLVSAVNAGLSTYSALPQ